MFSLERFFNNFTLHIIFDNIEGSLFIGHLQIVHDILHTVLIV